MKHRCIPKQILVCESRPSDAKSARVTVRERNKKNVLPYSQAQNISAATLPDTHGFENGQAGKVIGSSVCFIFYLKPRYPEQFNFNRTAHIV